MLGMNVCRVVIASAILEDSEMKKQEIVKCKAKELEKHLELSVLVSLRDKKCAELDELKVCNLRKRLFVEADYGSRREDERV